MPKKKHLTDAELLHQLKSSTPAVLRTFMVYEKLTEKIIQNREYRLEQQTYNDTYQFRGKEDLNKKLNFLEEAWKEYVRIEIRMLDKETMEITFRLIA